MWPTLNIRKYFLKGLRVWVRQKLSRGNRHFFIFIKPGFKSRPLHELVRLINSAIGLRNSHKAKAANPGQVTASAKRANNSYPFMVTPMPNTRNKLVFNALVRRWRGILEGAFAVEEVDDVALMRLQPVEGQCLHFADIQPIDVSRI